jgi:23S rRNA (pseudouridine1915-N3)-methyltransferase
LITILACGSSHDKKFAEAIDYYETLLSRRLPVSWELVSSAAKEHHSSDEKRRVDSEVLRKRLKPNDVIILLDETGKTYTSEQLSSLIFSTLLPYKTSGRLVFVIGGAFGVDDDLKSASHCVLSLSSLVFPHQLVRLILVEQLYRAMSIDSSSNYHHS